MAKILAWGIGILVAVTLAVVAFVPDVEIRIPEGKVRAAIRDRLPILTELPEAEVKVTEADVDFIGGGESGGVGLTGEIKVSGFGLGGSGTIETRTSVRYEDGAFYLSDLQLDDLQLSPNLVTKAKMAALKKAWEVFLDDVEEDIRADGNDEQLAEFLEVRNTIGPIVRTALDNALANIPVYRLQGSAAKGAARLILKDIAFTDDEAIAILSPGQALIKIATAVISALVLALLAWDWVQRQKVTAAADETV